MDKSKLENRKNLGSDHWLALCESKIYKKKKVKVHPRTAHESPDGD